MASAPTFVTTPAPSTGHGAPPARTGTNRRMPQAWTPDCPTRASGVPAGRVLADSGDGVWILRPNAEQAERLCRHLPGWLARLRTGGARQVVIDLHRVRRLDFTGFGLLLRLLRDVLGVPVVITEAAGHVAATLSQLDLLADARLVPAPHRPPRTSAPAAPCTPRRLRGERVLHPGSAAHGSKTRRTARSGHGDRHRHRSPAASR
ncbi:MULTISPECIES: STAS domain-containing protein [Actinomycetes]|uniref:STAS domain-containing protein n=2 Tax=Actinomycetota TaxID=201174 RepID=A0A2N3X137_9PSEU|nr:MULTISPECIES: STAS domain-containing protein [Actinomycetes]MBF6375429.1 STAS domain-containing protein [Nocardia farcinica]MBF6382186.1 STAS domain-containing protein [Nocardia farcinica]PKV99832.1 STAS domain-containing protein [Amycolatopsis niigatensis]